MMLCEYGRAMTNRKIVSLVFLGYERRLVPFLFQYG